MLPRNYALPVALLLSCLGVGGYPVVPASDFQAVLSAPGTRNDVKVLILGGGVAGVTAARTLHEHGIDDFIIVEAREELGGRMMSHRFGAADNEWTVEVGANWVQGTQYGDGPANPIWDLAKKHNVSTHSSNYFGSVATYDNTGANDFQDVFQEGVKHFEKLTALAGARVPLRLVDMTARSGYSIAGIKPRTRYEAATEYYQFDWEFGATPEETSWLSSAWAHNHTFSAEAGGFSAENLLSVDQRGFKTLVQAEAATFLKDAQLMLNSTVKFISTHKDREGVQVTLTDGTTISADYVLCTFSLGVLQHDDVQFVPALPPWKQEAIHSMSMGTYTKIFLQFPEKFWFDTEMALYADDERGRYPVWQSLDHPDFFPGCGILFVTVTGSFSRRIERMTDDAVQAEILSVLRSMFPGRDVPEPLAFHFPRWHNDPLFRGSYSNWPANFLSEHQKNLRADVDKRLWFAGEATSRRWFGFLHGAYDEGLKVGTAIAECINEGQCEGRKHVEKVINAFPYAV